MKKIFENCYKMDEKCYKEFALSEDILMEHAATAMANYIERNFLKGSSILIVSGAGNNGADGIALARLLHKSYEVKLFLPFGAKSDMAKLQLKRVNLININIVDEITISDIIVDCLFGAGLNRELNTQSIEIIEQLNSLDAVKIACDIPSGIDVQGNPTPTAFKADTTITMGALKEALYADNSKDYVGKIIVANLGIARELYEDTTSTYLLEINDFKPPIRQEENCHKGSFGHVAIFCGEKDGAAIISAMAASRFGAGLTTLVIHESVKQPPYLMKSTSIPNNTTAIAIGMGLGNFFEDDALRGVIDSNTPIVLDADALYNPNLLEIIKQKREVVITPHPKEFSAVLKILNGQDIDIATIQKTRLQLSREFSKAYPNCTLLLKGANPIIAKDGVCYINNHGDKVLAKGGSGDVLSGLIASLLAQGYSALDAAINGSLALALASKAYTKPNYFMLSTDIIDELANIVY